MQLLHTMKKTHVDFYCYIIQLGNITRQQYTEKMQIIREVGKLSLLVNEQHFHVATHPGEIR